MTSSPPRRRPSPPLPDEIRSLVLRQIDPVRRREVFLAEVRRVLVEIARRERPDIAEDLAHEALTEAHAFSQRERLDMSAQSCGRIFWYARRALVRDLADEGRKKKRRRTDASTPAVEIALEQGHEPGVLMAAPDREAEEVLEVEEARAAMRQVSAELSETHRRIVALRDQGLSAPEVARRVGCTRQNVEKVGERFWRRAGEVYEGGRCESITRDEFVALLDEGAAKRLGQERVAAVHRHVFEDGGCLRCQGAVRRIKRGVGAALAETLAKGGAVGVGMGAGIKVAIANLFGGGAGGIGAFTAERTARVVVAAGAAAMLSVGGYVASDEMGRAGEEDRAPKIEAVSPASPAASSAGRSPAARTAPSAATGGLATGKEATARARAEFEPGPPGEAIPPPPPPPPSPPSREFEPGPAIAQPHAPSKSAAEFGP